MTTSNPTQVQGRGETGERAYAPRLGPDPGPGASPTVDPDPRPGKIPVVTDPAGFQAGAPDPGLSVPEGLGTSITGPWPPGPDDPRLSPWPKDIGALLSVALSLAEGHGAPGPGGAAPLIQAFGFPEAEFPGIGAINDPAAEGQALPGWLAAASPAPPWASQPLAPTGLATGPGYGFPAAPALAPPPFVGPFPVERIREDFPILGTTVDGGLPLIWFDNAATTQKPQAVIDRLALYYREENSNVHRGAHYLANKATEAYEEARRKVAAFIGAPGPENIVFVRGTTEGVNLVAQAFAAPRLGPGDEIILTELEHHANIVPWQILAQRKGAFIRVLPIDDHGQLILEKLPGLIGPRTKIISLSHVSNALGTVTEVSEVISLAKSHGIPVAIDAAQSVAHVPIDVKALGADFLVFSGHKIYGPTGIGVVYGTTEALNEAQPWQGGGNMISDVTFERTLYREPPVRFEAGTPNIAGAVGLGAALDYLGALGLDRVALYEEALLHYLTGRLGSVPGLTIIGTPAKRAGVVSFVLANKSVAEVGAHLARHGVALRAGHHCAQPAVRRFGLEGTVRPSPAFYNTPAEVDRFIEILGLLV